jgi:hypothetical protein
LEVHFLPHGWLLRHLTKTHGLAVLSPSRIRFLG